MASSRRGVIVQDSGALRKVPVGLFWHRAGAPCSVLAAVSPKTTLRTLRTWTDSFPSFLFANINEHVETSLSLQGAKFKNRTEQKVLK